MTKENLKMRGDVVITHLNCENKIVDVLEIQNLIVTAGKEYVAARILNGTVTPLSHIGVGTSSTVPALGQTALLAQIDSRIAITTATVNQNVVTYSCTFPPGTCTGNINEAGLFNAVSGGTMMSRVSFSEIAKLIDDTIIIGWSITIL